MKSQILLSIIVLCVGVWPEWLNEGHERNNRFAAQSGLRLLSGHPGLDCPIRHGWKTGLFISRFSFDFRSCGVSDQRPSRGFFVHRLLWLCGAALHLECIHPGACHDEFFFV